MKPGKHDCLPAEHKCANQNSGEQVKDEIRIIQTVLKKNPKIIPIKSKVVILCGNLVSSTLPAITKQNQQFQHANLRQNFNR